MRVTAWQTEGRTELAIYTVHLTLKGWCSQGGWKEWAYITPDRGNKCFENVRKFELRTKLGRSRHKRQDKTKINTQQMWCIELLGSGHKLSPLYNGYRVSFSRVKRPGSGLNHPSPFSAEVKERVELYLYTLYGPSWPVLWRTLPLPWLGHRPVAETCANEKEFRVIKSG